MTYSLPSIAVLGAGNMAGAVLNGLLAADVLSTLPVWVTTKSQASAARFDGESRVLARSLEKDENASSAAVTDAQIVILGVKPHLIGELLDQVADKIADEAVVISVAAGISTQAIEAKLNPGLRVVRAMPNTPAAIGLGATGIAAGSKADEQAMSYARTIFSAVGTVIEVPEEKIAEVAAISGSGPAHVYYLIEQLIEASTRIGMSEQDAHDLVVQTFRGAVSLVHAHPELAPEELRRRVTSPNGTTEQSVKVLREAGIAAIFTEAMRANIRRSNELAAEKG